MKHTPMIGMASEVSGTFPATSSKNTEMATIIDTPMDTFSPEIKEKITIRKQTVI